ncbi:pyridoxamine kinase [Acetonema longum]|uniref:pyridoxal kinase n=1 Tax=Acetonema longum DSM 6540 TaxID=1009370 RepID=F7NGE3_9FIRM|nr:pyridoxamine kinase [Acetonema longum]EGO64898.1 pyridoxamine kinase [Acetonema longum DSM 6540]
MNMPRIAAVHDLSCFGRCSLTVIIPTLSCMGIQVCPLPTAILSTHLGGFKNVAFADLTDHMGDSFRHWKMENISFDCIYSGFLASERQIDVVADFIDVFSKNRPMVLVDPVMGDKGKLYSVYTPRMQEHMRKLIQKADVITPNYTEACFLLEKPYEEDIAEPAALQDWLISLADLGPDKIVMTGIPQQEKLLNMGFERSTGRFWQVASPRIPVSYPGTGDIFASVLAGALLQQSSLSDAIQKAAGFVEQAIRITFAAGAPVREGVLLERALAWLYQDSQNSDQ